MSRNVEAVNAWSTTAAVRTRPGIFRCAPALALILAVMPTSALFAQDKPDAENLKRLVDKIARGDEVEADAASERLIEIVTTPVAEAIGSLSDRPMAEQLRLRTTLARLTGALRARLHRLELSPPDRALHDVFARAYPELVERLFDGDWRVRAAAVRQIPVEPNTAAGLLIAAKVNDPDADVALAALDAAAALHDPIVARALTRYIQDAVRALKAGLYGPHQADLERVTALFVQRSIAVVAAAEYEPGAPAAIEALRYFSRTRYWNQTHRAAVLHSLGKFADPRVVPVLMDFLDDPGFLRWRPVDDDRRASSTVGDVVLAELLKRHQLTPEDFNLYVAPDDSTFAGSISEEERQEGRRAFRIWYEQNAKDRSDRLEKNDAAKSAADKD